MGSVWGFRAGGRDSHTSTILVLSLDVPSVGETRAVVGRASTVLLLGLPDLQSTLSSDGPPLSESKNIYLS